MDQHIISRFYVAGFTDPDTPTGQEPYVWTYSAERLEWRRRAPKNVATEPDYYTRFTEDGQRDDAVEEMFNKMESVVAPLLLRLSAGQQTLSEEERLNLSLFTAMMKLRVPAMHENIGDFLGNVGSTMLAVMYGVFKRDPEKFQRYKEQYRTETGRTVLDNMKVEDFNPDKYQIGARHSATVRYSLMPIIEFANTLRLMGWSFLVTSSPNYFITSDDPYFMIDLTNKERIYGDGLAAENIEISLPLSRNVLLYITWKYKGADRWVNATQNIVEQMNLRRMGTSALLIAPKPDFPGSSKLQTGEEVWGQEVWGQT